jgi:hypothetical protein
MPDRHIGRATVSVALLREAKVFRDARHFLATGKVALPFSRSRSVLPIFLRDFNAKFC